MGIVCMMCEKHYLESFLEELADWEGEGLKVYQYGDTGKLGQAYILIECATPLPDIFLGKLNSDSDIINFIAFGSTNDKTIRPSAITLEW